MIRYTVRKLRNLQQRIRKDGRLTKEERLLDAKTAEAALKLILDQDAEIRRLKGR